MAAVSNRPEQLRTNLAEWLLKPNIAKDLMTAFINRAYGGIYTRAHVKKGNTSCNLSFYQSDKHGC